MKNKSLLFLLIFITQKNSWKIIQQTCNVNKKHMTVTKFQ